MRSESTCLIPLNHGSIRLKCVSTVERNAMERHTARRAADMINDLIVAHTSDAGDTPIDVHEAMAIRDDLRELADCDESREHIHEVGDTLIDDYEPTPSPEKNTVKVVELFDTRADEFVIESENKTVAECENNKYYPDDDLVVAGVYPNLGGDMVWHFPESRLRLP